MSQKDRVVPVPFERRPRLAFDTWFDVVFWPRFPIGDGREAARLALRTIYDATRDSDRVELSKLVLAGLERDLRAWRGLPSHLKPTGRSWIERRCWRDAHPRFGELCMESMNLLGEGRIDRAQQIEMFRRFVDDPQIGYECAENVRLLEWQLAQEAVTRP